jgi:hypothetical protein
VETTWSPVAGERLVGIRAGSLGGAFNLRFSSCYRGSVYQMQYPTSHRRAVTYSGGVNIWCEVEAVFSSTILAGGRQLWCLRSGMKPLHAQR